MRHSSGFRQQHRWAVRVRHGLFLLWLVAASSVLAQEANLQPSDEVPGSGFHVPNTDLTIGGYVTGEYAEHEAPVLSISNASLLFWWENDSPLKFFSEIDLQRGLSAQGSLDTSQTEYLSLERLYADYALSDDMTVRLGKYLTPIGRWNQNHADPLVWTTSRPLVTDLAFPTNATGLMLLGTVEAWGKALDYAVYAAESDDLRPAPNVDPFSHALGLRFNLNWSDSLQLGTSLASFAQQSATSETKNLLGLDFLYQKNGYEASGEAVYRLSESTSEGNERGFFIQGVAPLGGRLFAVYRYELFNSVGPQPGPQVNLEALLAGPEGVDGGLPFAQHGFPPPPPTVRLNILGLAYRYRPNLVMKIEFVDGSAGAIRVPLGVLSSISVLF